MKLYYPAVFERETDGRYSINFPDVPEAITCGDDLNHGIEMAKECLGMCLEGRKEDDLEIPKASEVIECDKNQFIVMVEFDSVEFNKKYNNKSVRKNVTIPAWLNEMAEHDNINFSNVLQNALMELLHIN